MTTNFSVTSRAVDTDLFFAPALTGTAVTVKAGPTDVRYAGFKNGGAATTWVQIFDALLANVTLGTTVPQQSYPVAAGEYFELRVGEQLQLDVGLVIAATTTAGGLTPPVAALVANVIYV